MNPQPVPALSSGDPSVWDQALYAFLVEKGNRSGSTPHGRVLLAGCCGRSSTAGRPTSFARPTSSPTPTGSASRAERRRRRRSAPGSPACRRSTASSSGWASSARTRATPWSGRGPSPLPPAGSRPTRSGGCWTVVPDTVAGRRDRAILLTFILTGRRRAEVMALTAGDITVEDGVAFYSYRGKGGKRGRRELPAPGLSTPSSPAWPTWGSASRRWTPRRPSGTAGPPARASRARRSTVASSATSGRRSCRRPGSTSFATRRRSCGAMPASRSRRLASFLDHSSLGGHDDLPSAARGPDGHGVARRGRVHRLVARPTP